MTQLVRVLSRPLAAIGASVALVVGSGLGVQAAQTPSTITIVHTAGMTLECSKLSPSAARYAIAHKLCSSLGPYNTATGDCGTTALYILSAGGGTAKFLESALSTQGNMVFVHHHVNWNNWSQNRSSSVDGNTGWNSNYWSNADYVPTGYGYVTASQSGYVILWWGGVCTFLPTSDGEYI